MHHKGFIIAALASAAVIAVPVVNKRQATDGKKEVWHGKDNGNTRLTFSGRTATLGTRSINDIIDALNKDCGTSVCQEQETTLETELFTPTDRMKYTITIAPEGDYRENERDDMIEALSAAAKELEWCETISYDFTPECPATPGIVICNDMVGPEDHVVCEVPDFWAIQYTNKDKQDGIIKVSISSEKNEDDSGWCDTLATVGSTVAGAVNPISGGVFSLAGIFC